MRVILYTGKGGVGKTSMAAISAYKMAAMGKKVLIMSTDQAHSLGDCFDKKIGNEPTAICNNLDALEIDASYESERSWAHIQKYMKLLLTLKNEDSIEVEELMVFPGLEELFSMMRILDFYEQNVYDVVVVDCAPTGETLSLLQYPEKLGGFMEKVMPIKRKGVKIAGPMVEKLIKIPMPEENVFDDIEFLMNRMEKLQQVMQNKDVVSVRIVTTPEQIVITEAKRNFTYMHLFNYNVDAVFINKIYPQQAMEGYFSKWCEMQKEGLRMIGESFSEIPKFEIALQKSEVRTLPVIQKLAEELFENIDLALVMFEKEIYQIVTERNETYMKIYLPFANKQDLDLQQVEQEIVISIKNEVRRFPMPKQLAEMEIEKAKLKEEYLLIYFRKEE